MSLRPVREADLAVLESLTENPEVTGEFAWFGYGDPMRYRRSWAENALLGPEGGTLMVAGDTGSLGFVSWGRRRTTRSSYCWVLGIAMLPDARGRGLGTQAHRLLARYLFDHTTAHRLEADTETGNVAEQRALEKAGFVREGIMRGCAWRDGAWRDGVIYSLLRTDPRP
ncbi:GNAT family protein [Actinomadura vinacea]|uniref:GNAT family protein n=1 Tax=Actinomadura vinacea TaxID=115336 RepID=A0ABP5WYA3_9ACTN